MKGKVLVTMLCGMIALVASPVLGAYTSIQHNLFDLNTDTTFTPGSGEFSIAATNEGLLTLNDPTALTGVVSNVSVNLTTFFDSVLGTGEAKFVGGSYSLSFDFDPDGAPPPDSHTLSGPVAAIFFDITQVGPNSRIDGLGRWFASVVDLPGSNTWPDGGGPSSIDSLTIAFAQDLSSYDWTTPLTGRVESLYSLFPDDRAIPEPASLGLLAFGALALVRRRR